MAFRLTIPLVIIGLYFWMRSITITGGYGDVSPTIFSFFKTILKIITAAGFYLKIMIFPYPHQPFIGTLPSSFPFLTPAGLLLLLVFGGMVLALIRREALVGVCLVFTLAVLAPAVFLAVLPVATTVAAKRYVYGPSAGFLIVAAWLILKSSDILSSTIGWPQRKIWVVTGLLCGILMTVWGWENRHRNAVWRSPITFWEVVALNPDNFVAHYNLGGALRNMGKIDEAIFHFSESLRLKPDYADTSNNLANLLMSRGRFNEAVSLYNDALKYKPDNADVYYNLAIALEKQGNPDSAIEHYYAALKIDPKSPVYHNSLGNALVDQGKHSDAIVHYSEALKIKPDYAEAHYNMGNASVRQEKYRESIYHYMEAIKIKPDYIEAHNNLGGAYAKLGQWDDALKKWNDTLSINPDHQVARQNRDAVMKMLGQ